ncbi:MAG: SMC family ATPase [Rubrobacter sp.]|nr:SMC family ATPase [Rubrobacter sp.]
MILERLYLENYKQFREPTELLPPEGVVGIVGSNGSGKTTIFESILWAFFGSRGKDARFSNDSIPWSGGTTTEKTTVEVTLNIAGAPYRVVRTLYRGKTEARVYSVEEEIVGGSSETAEWVQESLLGMDRVAFEATFFARQKELEFFAGVTGIKRQREIARILGIDQVEGAQELLRADKKKCQNEAGFLEARIAGVDREILEEELKKVRRRQDRLMREVSCLREKLEGVEDELSRARAEGETLEASYRRHNKLSSLLAAAESARERAAEKVQELSKTLVRLDKDEEELIGKLRPQIERLPEVEIEIEGLEEARRSHERRVLAEKEMRRLEAEAHRAVVAASQLLEKLDRAAEPMRGLGDEPLPGWDALFSVEDEADRMLGAERILSGAATHLWKLEERFRSLKEAKARQEELFEAERELEESRVRVEERRKEVARLDTEVENVTGGGTLEKELARLRKEERSLQRQSAQQKGLAEADERDAEKLDRARRMVEHSEEVASCPTCHRGFEGDEHKEVIETLLRQAGEARGRAAEARSECRRLEEEAQDLLRRLAEVEQRREKECALREERAKATTYLEDLRDLLKRASARVERLLEELEGVAPVSEDDLEEVELRVGLLRMLHDAYPRIESFTESHSGASAAVAERERELAYLGATPVYEETRHVRLREEKAELERLLGRIESLQARLRDRPKVKERLEITGREQEEATREAERLQEKISSLAFVEDVYRANRKRVMEVERAREELRGEKETLDQELGRVQSRVENLEGEIVRYEEQRKLADERGQEAVRLGEMDKLLSRFYKGLTARTRPRLEKEASLLIKALTDDRYERMEFDENYGIRLFDGLSDAYEISRFSGGEADIVSLSARVALSKMVAAKGSEALGFIVLDEVFGALDADRRRNVLLALDRLKRTFGQIFVISHVGDVQESALLDELWMVEEDEEGKSTVRRLKANLDEPVVLLGNTHGS